MHTVTEADAASGRYSAWQVVLPLPGTDVRMPTTAEGAFFSQWLQFDGIDPACPALERGAMRREYEGLTAEGSMDSQATAAWEAAAEEEEAANWFILPGDSRALLLRPRKMSWAVVRTDDEGSSSDAEGGEHRPRCRPAVVHARHRSRNRKAGVVPAAAATSAADDTACDPASAGPATSTATEPHAGSESVRVEFDLPPGAYATMALREVSKHQRPASRLTHIRFDL